MSFSNSYHDLDQNLPMKCNGVQHPSADPILNYNEYATYVSTKFETERNQRIQDIRKNKPVSSIEHYTDKFLTQELFSLYGSMDESHPKFKLLFKNYKEERLEQVRDWIREETEIVVHDDVTSIQPTFFDLTMIEEDDNHSNNAHATSKDSIFFPESNPFQISLYNIPISIDPFVLPRRKKSAKDIKNEYVTQKRTLDGLVQFDPDINLDKITVPSACLRGMGQELVNQIISIVRKYPTGITAKSLSTELRKLSIRKLSPSANYEELISKYGQQLCFMQKICSEYPEVLYFPKCLDGLIVTPIQMFSNIWHKLQIIVNWKFGIVKLSKAFILCCDIFGWARISVSHWGFKNEVHFIQFLVHYFGGNFKIISELDIKNKGREDVFYLISVSTQKQKQLMSSLVPLRTSKETLHQEGRNYDSSRQNPLQTSRQGQIVTNKHHYGEEMKTSDSNNPGCWNPNVRHPPLHNTHPDTRPGKPYFSHPQQDTPKSSPSFQSVPSKWGETPQNMWKPTAAMKTGQQSSVASTNGFPALGEVQVAKKSGKHNNPKPKSWNKLF
ncbi:uncharacterized protein LOC110862011 [Folsomia candida]|uniref:Annexin A11 n=1 Tax=Folsomia candida TaxID=158441 RepID=A0A226CZN7_FOLCA|nr:uncharacterized protein LOC110862011 [Folsomia candida]XP_035701105.1 uncharacterized protein LOC110862011 [Folsomia candida]OXA38084.1 Annexin A11 [Folsomia candida]